MAKSDATTSIQEGKDHRAVYNGRGHKSKDSDVNVNLLYVDLKQSVPNSYAKNPKIFFHPESEDAETACQIMELISDSLIKKTKLKNIMRKVSKCIKFDPIAATKTYFYFTKSQSGVKSRYDETIINDEIRTDHVLLEHLLKDADSKTYEESPWIGHKIKASVADICTKFEIKDEDEIKKIKRLNEKQETVNVDDRDLDKFQFGEYVEIEDRVNEKLFYIIDGLQKIYDEKDKSVPFDTMYDFLDPNFVDGSEERHADAYFWKDQRRDVNNFRTMLSENAYKGNSKIITRGPEFTSEQIGQLTSPESKGLVHLETTQSVERLEHAQVDPQTLQSLQMTMQDIQLISKNAPRQSQQEKTATEVKAVEAANQEVQGEDRDLLEEMVASIATKWAKLAWKNYTTERVIKLTGITDSQYVGFKNTLGDVITKDGKNRIRLRFSKEHLSPFLNATVKAGSMQPDNQQTRVANLTNFGAFISKIPQAISFIDLEQVVLEAAEVFGVKNDNLLKKKENPFEESKLLNAGTFIAPQMSDDDEYHLQIHQTLSNGSPESDMHMMVHTLQLAEKRKIQEVQMARAMAASQGGNPQMPQTGSSFIGQAPQPLTPSPLPTQPVNAGIGPNQIPASGMVPQ